MAVSGGFVGNFFMAYLPYKIWASFFGRNENIEPTLKSAKKIAVFAAIAVLSAAGCAVIIGWWLDLLGLVPFAALGSIIVINNAIPTLVLSPILLIALYPRGQTLGPALDRDHGAGRGSGGTSGSSATR